MTNLFEKKETNLVTGGVSRGFEGLDEDIVTMPKAKIMQAMSPELEEPDVDFQQGDIVHSLLLEKLPEYFTPIAMWISRAMFVPRNDREKKDFFETLGMEEQDTMFVCRSLNGQIPEPGGLNYGECRECPYGEFGWDGDVSTPPLCTKTLNVLALFEGQEMPVVIQFMNTNFKHGKKFASMARYAGGDLFSKKYKISSKQEQNDQGKFFTTPVKPAGKPTDEEKEFAEKLYAQFAGVQIEVEDEEDQAQQEQWDF